jgi:probable HAF family extracellular repeat protein
VDRNFKYFAVALLAALAAQAAGPAWGSGVYNGVTDVGPSDPNLVYAYAFGLNNSGQVAGYDKIGGVVHAFRYTSGTLTDLGTLPGGTVSTAYSINAAGQVVGYASISGSNVYRAYRYSGGSMTNLGALGGQTSTSSMKSLPVV